MPIDRRRFFLFFTLTALLLFTANAHSTSQTNGAGSATSANGFGQITVKDTHIAEFDSSHIRIAVDLVVTPSRGATLEGLQLTSLRLNGLPVYAEPLTQSIELAQGKVIALPPVYVTARVRDLTSAAPLREMVEKQMVHVQGQVVADVKMNFFQKLAMHTEHPRILLPLTEDVPVDFGSVPFARQAALGALTVIELGIKGRTVARKNLPSLESPWIHDLETQAITNLLQVETSYVLKQHDTSYPVILDQLGFRLVSGQIITTAEAKAPWEYDPEFLSKIKSGEAKMGKDSVEVQLRPASKQATDTAPLLLTHKDFTLGTRGTADKDELIIQKTKPGHPEDDGDFTKVNVQRRASPNALAIIELQAPLPNAGFHAAPATVAQQDSWEKVAIYRLIPDSTVGKSTIEVVQLSAHRDGQAIRLDESVDSSFFGSPILTPEGVIGFVQDERAGAFLPADLASAASSVSAVAVQAEPDSANL
jgi:hypothetical protein